MDIKAIVEALINHDFVTFFNFIELIERRHLDACKAKSESPESPESPESSEPLGAELFMNYLVDELALVENFDADMVIKAMAKLDNEIERSSQNLGKNAFYFANFYQAAVFVLSARLGRRRGQRTELPESLSEEQKAYSSKLSDSFNKEAKLIRGNPPKTPSVFSRVLG